MVAKIHPLKIENLIDGDSMDFAPTESNSTTDHISTKGIAFENSDLTLLYGNAGKMTFLDTEVPTITLKQILDRIANAASPGFTWGRSGNVSSGSWLQNDSVPSNISGRKIDFSSPKLNKILVTNENNNTFTVGVYEHDGTTYTQLATLALTAERTKSASYSVNITNGKELAVKLESGSCKNIVVGVVLSGSN